MHQKENQPNGGEGEIHRISPKDQLSYRGGGEETGVKTVRGRTTEPIEATIRLGKRLYYLKTRPYF